MMVRKFKIDKQTFNEKYLCLYDNKNRFKTLYGGSGSGKSEGAFRMMILHHISRKGMNVLVLRKHQTSARKSVFPLLVKIIKEYGLDKDVYEIKETRMEIINKMNGNTILCTGLDDEEKVKSITFKNGILTTIMMEEANEFVENDFKQLNLRLRGQAPSPFEIYILFNPIISKQHWIHRIFFANEKANTFILHTTCDDNKYVDDDYKNELMELAKIDEVFYKVYYKGEFANLDTDSNWIKNELLSSSFQHLDKINNADRVTISCDVARYGNDLSTVFVMIDNHVKVPIEYSKLGTTELAREIQKIVDEYKTIYPSAYFRLHIDGTGIGGGVVDALMDKYSYDDLTIKEINFAHRCGKKYKNLISELWWNLKEKLIKNEITMENDERVVSEIVDRNYCYTSDGKFKIEDKDDWKKRHEDKSPDFSDGICLLFWESKSFIV